jgi:replication factor A1
MSDFGGLFSILVEKSGLSVNEVRKKIEDRKESLGHLINDEVAVRLVARDLGITLFNEKVARPVVKIEDLVPNINNVTISVRVEKVGSTKQFTKKNGTTGKVGRVIISDETGKTSLVFWDDKTSYLLKIKMGEYVTIFSAYTKEGLNGDIEVHMGNKSRLELSQNSQLKVFTKGSFQKGRLWRIYDPIEFTKREGDQGRVVAFLFKREEGIIRVLVWNPSDSLLLNLREGVAVVILGGIIKPDFHGEAELHINDESLIRVDSKDIVNSNIEVKKLANIQPDMSDLTIEGIVERDFNVETTHSGKSYARVLLKDNKTTLSVVFWNDKAIQVKRIAKLGVLLRVEGCYSKIGPYGLELNVSKWSKTRSIA